jgi:hypothetical protein
MRDRDTGGDEPRWLRLAADLRAEPGAGTLARVRARLAARSTAPAWVGWLARPVGLATAVGLLVASAWAGNAWLSAAGAERPDAGALVSALLGEDGSFGLAVDAGNGGEPRATDSTGAER